MSLVKWKYCAIKSDLGVKFFHEKGEHTVRKFEEEENSDLHKTIAELGTEGWELVGLSPVPESKAWVYYFKQQA